MICGFIELGLGFGYSGVCFVVWGYLIGVCILDVVVCAGCVGCARVCGVLRGVAWRGVLGRYNIMV
jgi:hypothetical protein